ncbi:unnamed protein product [Closterium sp. Naga37s-1]|nr:unnamed protein product [Closterium sp. Naga37s-1]
MSLQFDAWQVVRDEKDLGDYEALQQRFGENPRFQIMQNLQKRWPGLSFNDVQFRMLARSACFVSVQGGGCTLQSYFGGTHIVYFHLGHPLSLCFEQPPLLCPLCTARTQHQGMQQQGGQQGGGEKSEGGGSAALQQCQESAPAVFFPHHASPAAARHTPRGSFPEVSFWHSR